MSNSRAPIALIVLSLLAVSTTAAPASGVHLTESVTIGGDTFWDAITYDGASQHLFITHGTHVVVLDSQTYAVAGDIPGVAGAHQVVVGGGKGLATAGQTNSVVLFDPVTLQVTGTLQVGTRPDGIVYDPVTRRAFAFNAGSNNATAIDVASGSVAGTIALSGKPEFAVADGAGHIYDNVEDTSEVVEIDAKTMAVVQRWSLTPCESPSGIAIDVKHARLFLACENEMMAVVDTATGKVVATVPTGKGADGAAYDSHTQTVFIPLGEGKLSIIHQDTPDAYHLVENATTQAGARTIDFDSAGGRVFTVTADLTPAPGEHPPYKIGPGSFRLLVFSR